MERRSSERAELDHETSIFTKDGYFTAVLENISTGGLFLRTNKPIELGDMIEITLPLPGNQERRSLTVNVVAVRIMANGVAFRFREIDDDARSMLFLLNGGATA